MIILMSRKQKCEIPTLGILDIDGSLVKSVYGDYELLKDPDLLDKVLSGLPPFPWVRSSGILDKMTVVKTITGRQARQRDLTLAWFARELGINDMELIMVSFKTKDQYIADKENAISRLITEWWSIHDNGARIVIIEDDPIILDFLRAKFLSSGLQIVAVDVNGIPHFS